MDRGFVESAAAVDEARDGVWLRGYVGASAFHRGKAVFLFVSGRYVCDRAPLGAARGASDLFKKR